MCTGRPSNTGLIPITSLWLQFHLSGHMNPHMTLYVSGNQQECIVHDIEHLLWLREGLFIDTDND